MVDTYSFGYWVSRRRKALDLTREELARRVGCAAETIKKIERDERRPSRQIAELLANALAVPTEQQTLFLQVARGERPVGRLHLTSQPLRSLPKKIHNLPIYLTSFIGRENELNAIDKLLDNPDCRLLTLAGPGGIGKTRLALRVAEGKLDTFFHGVWFVALAPLQSAEHIDQAIASAIDFNFSDEGDPQTQLLRHLRCKEMLLVLDNFEHLMDGATLVVEILRTTPDIKVLVTSRERLNLEGEFTFKIEGLTYPIDGHTSVKDDFSAIQLFVERAHRVQPQVVFSEADYAAIADICQLVEGLPLAIELAAAWMRLLSCQEITQEIQQSLGILRASTRHAPERHSSMQAVFDHSWRLLCGAEQVVLRQLSVFRDGFTREAAEQVSGASLTILSTLADKSLLHLKEGAYDPQRYDLHELVRQYAGERLLEAGETDLLRERHLNYFVELAEKAEQKFRRAEQIGWLNRVKVEHDNLRTALAWSLSKDAEAGLRLGAALYWFWRVSGFINEGCEWLAKILALPDATSHARMRAKALYGAAALEAARHENGKARALFEESLTLTTDLGDKQGIAMALNGLGLIARRQYDWENAPIFFEKALTIGREIGDQELIAASLEGLGLMAQHQRDWVTARYLFEEFLAIERELGNKAYMANALLGLGSIAFAQGDISVAHERFEESLSLYRELGFKQFMALLFNRLGDVARYKGDYEQALTLYSESLNLFQEPNVGLKHDYALVLINLGFVAYRRGDYARAKEWFKESLLLYQELEDEGSSAFCLIGLAGTIASTQGSEKAVILISAARAMLDAMDAEVNPADQAEYEHNLGVVRAQLDMTRFQAAWATGRAMTLGQAIAYALDDEIERNAGD